MNWFYLSLAAAFFTAITDVLNKIILQSLDEWLTIWLDLLVAIIFLMGFAPFFHFTFPGIEMYLVILELLPLEILAYYLYMKAIKTSPLSLTIPLLAFTPAFTILTAGFLLGEGIGRNGVLGVFLVTMGAYILNGELISNQLLDPIKAIFSVPGSRIMLFVAIIYSITATLGKKGVLLSDPFSFGLSYIIAQALALTCINLFRFTKNPSLATSLKDSRTLKLVLASGISLAFIVITHYSAIKLAPVSYMISVKRLSLVMSVLFGWAIFKEENMRYRISGSCLMLGGAILLYLTV